MEEGGTPASNPLRHQVALCLIAAAECADPEAGGAEARDRLVRLLRPLRGFPEVQKEVLVRVNRLFRAAEEKMCSLHGEEGEEAPDRGECLAAPPFFLD